MFHYTAYTVLIFGVALILTGGISYILPNAVLWAFSLPPEAHPSVIANATAKVTMGVFYILAFTQRNEEFFRASVWVRIFTAVALWKLGGYWQYLATAELLSAGVTQLMIGAEEESPNPPQEDDYLDSEDEDSESGGKK